MFGGQQLSPDSHSAGCPGGSAAEQEVGETGGGHTGAEHTGAEHTGAEHLGAGQLGGRHLGADALGHLQLYPGAVLQVRKKTFVLQITLNIQHSKLNYAKI